MPLLRRALPTLTRRTSARLLALLATVLAGAAVIVPAPAARAAVPEDWAGVNAQWLFPALPRAAWDAHLDAMQAAGIRVVRLDAEWRRVEPDAPVGGTHGYRWGFYDSVAGALAARGIRWYPIVDYSAPWASSVPGEWRAAPASAGTFAEYAAALARRYGPGGTFWAAHPELPAQPVREWEVWNEENGAYFWPGAPDPAAYADLYLATRDALHAVDPGARVVVGGLLARGSGSFVAGMLDARPRLRGALDAVALHSYGPTVAASLSTMVDLRNWLTHLGLASVPIEVTEVGWTTSGAPSAVSDATRARTLEDLLPAAAALPGISRLLVHTWTTREQWSQNGEDWYGLFRADGTPNLSGTAFVRALAALRPRQPEARVVVPAPEAAAVAEPPAGARAAPAPRPRPASASRPRTARRTCGARATRAGSRARRACRRPASHARRVPARPSRRARRTGSDPAVLTPPSARRGLTPAVGSGRVGA